MSDPQYKLLIADDHPLFRGALKQALAALGEELVVEEVGDFDGAKARVASGDEFDLVLLDLAMPGASGFSGLITLHGMAPGLPIAIVSARDDAETVRRAVELGASGFISKQAGVEEIRRAVRVILDGGLCVPDGTEMGVEADADIADLIGRLHTLTPQQSRVLTMLAEGLLNKQIAYELGVSEATVKAHVSAILHKLDVDSRTQAVIRLSRIGLDPIQAA